MAMLKGCEYPFLLDPFWQHSGVETLIVCRKLEEVSISIYYRIFGRIVLLQGQTVRVRQSAWTI